MADSADRRSEGKGTSVHAAQYKRLRAQGICVACAKQAVKNRTYCYACSTKQAGATAKWGARKFLAAHGVDISRAKYELIHARQLYRGETALGALAAFLEALEPK